VYRKGSSDQSLSDRSRELKSWCRGNSGLNDRDLELKSGCKGVQGLKGLRSGVLGVVKEK
jgi:hypothetical protein